MFGRTPSPGGRALGAGAGRRCQLSGRGSRQRLQLHGQLHLALVAVQGHRHAVADLVRFEHVCDVVRAGHRLTAAYRRPFSISLQAASQPASQAVR